MKKQITALFILIFIAAGLAAETGYKGIRWGSSGYIIDLNEGKEENPITKTFPGYTTKVYEKQLLGEKTNVFYTLLDNYGLFGVYYFTSEANNGKLKANLKNKNLVEIIKYPKMEPDAVERLKNRFEEDKDRLLEWAAGFTLMLLPFGLETEYRYEKPETTGDGLISIYDYNDDTRIYIFENIIPEKTVVVYFPHEEDY